MAFAGLCILAFGGWILGLSASMFETLFLLVAADWNWFSLGQNAECATNLLCGVAWTELTGVDFAKRVVVFAGQFMLFYRFYPGSIVFCGSVLGGCWN